MVLGSHHIKSHVPTRLSTHIVGFRRVEVIIIFVPAVGREVDRPHRNLRKDRNRGERSEDQIQ